MICSGVVLGAHVCSRSDLVHLPGSCATAQAAPLQTLHAAGRSKLLGMGGNTEMWLSTAGLLGWQGCRSMLSIATWSQQRHLVLTEEYL